MGAPYGGRRKTGAYPSAPVCALGHLPLAGEAWTRAGGWDEGASGRTLCAHGERAAPVVLIVTGPALWAHDMRPDGGRGAVRVSLAIPRWGRMGCARTKGGEKVLFARGGA